MAKLQNHFNKYLLLPYNQFKLMIPGMTIHQAIAARLLQKCCEEMAVGAIEMAFERVLGKPERVVRVRRTTLKTRYLEAKTRAEEPVLPTKAADTKPVETPHKQSPVTAVAVTSPQNSLSVSLDASSAENDQTIILEAKDAPSAVLWRIMDKMGEMGSAVASQVVDNPSSHIVAEVLVSNLYLMAMRGGDLKAIELVFDYIDGAVADVVRLEGDNVIVVDDYSEIAPYNAVKDTTGVWCVEEIR